MKQIKMMKKRICMAIISLGAGVGKLSANLRQ